MIKEQKLNKELLIDKLGKDVYNSIVKSDNYKYCLKNLTNMYNNVDKRFNKLTPPRFINYCIALDEAIGKLTSKYFNINEITDLGEEDELLLINNDNVYFRQGTSENFKTIVTIGKIENKIFVPATPLN